MRADLIARQADSPDQRFEFGELQGVESELLRDPVNHLFVFGRVGCGIHLHALVVKSRFRSFEFRNDAPGDEFHDRLGLREIDERTSIGERRTSDTHVYLPSPAFNKASGVVWSHHKVARGGREGWHCFE